MTDFDWSLHADAIKSDADSALLGEGEGWLAWFSSGEDGITRHIAVRADDGTSEHRITIKEESDIGDTAEIASIIAGMTDRERERALAAIQCLEGGNA